MLFDRCLAFPVRNGRVKIDPDHGRIHKMADVVFFGNISKADALQEEGEALSEQLQALEEGLQGYGANVKAAISRVSR